MSGGVDSARSDQLRKVFLKALDVTVESVRPSDIQECFGPIRESIGHSMDGEVVKQLGKMKMNIETNFSRRCEKHDVVRALSSYKSSESASADPIESLQALSAEIEIQQLQEALLLLRQKNAALREDTERLSASAHEQIASLHFESQKMEDAAEQCIPVS